MDDYRRLARKKITISPQPHRIQQGLERRRGSILQSEEAGVQLQTVAGKTLVAGSGQVTFDVNFPITFTEQPALSFGGAVDDNQGHGTNAAASQFPVMNVMVLTWNRYERLVNHWFYKGANLSVTMTGSPGYVWVHWQATGKAFRNPAKDLGSTGGTL